MKIQRSFLVPLLFLSALIPLTALAQGTAFTYQGRLNDGANVATGVYELLFTIYDSANNPGAIIAGPVAKSPVAVTNGLFTVALDFGAGVFAGAERWLEIAVRTNGSGSFSALSPRQKLTPTPYAITAGNVTSGGLAAGTYGNAVTFNNSANSFNGNGAGLSNVNALSLGGLGASAFWQLGGNNASASQFLGTTNNQALEFRVNNIRALRMDTAGGVPSLVGGYSQNAANGSGGAVIAGGGTSGSINEALGNYAFVGAGHGAKAGMLSAVVGGAYNVAPNSNSFIGVGLANTNLGIGSVIVGGSKNLVVPLAQNAFVGGGVENTVNNQYAVVGGGEQNIASTFSTIGGGRANRGDGAYTTVAGGRGNQSIGTYASAGGGYVNISGGQNATVAGGALNVGDSASSAIGGGSNNVIQAGSDASVIAGGQNNSIHPNSVASTIAGGEWNTNEATHTTIGGGMGNRTGGAGATVGGGLQNTSSGAGATVGGGLGNSSSSDGATVPGGLFNTAAGQLSFAAGNRAKANHRGSFVWADSQDFDFASTAEDQFSIRALGGIHLETTGATINGRPLLTSADLGNLWQLGGNNVAPGQFLGTANAEPLEFKVNGQRALRLEPTLVTPNVVGGCEGNYVAPWAYGATIGGGGNAFSQTNKVEGPFGTIGGGESNTTGGMGATVAGGKANTAGVTVSQRGPIVLSGFYATVGGGFGNTSSGGIATISGGEANTADQVWTTVGGGFQNRASGEAATVPGGNANTASGDSSLAAGSYSAASGFISTALGEGNLASGHASVAIGSFTSATEEFTMAAGRKAKANHRGSFVWADSQNADFASTGANEFSIRAAGGVRLSDDTPNLSFGSTKRQMINLWNTNYGVGVQDHILYFRTDRDGGFAWYGGGIHSDNTFDGGGGVHLMRLTALGLYVNGILASSSDRNVKAGFAPVDPKEVLEKVAALPITRWHYTNDTATPHLGPVAQDFHAAFDLGADDKHIATVDADGVALAAIQGLNQKLEEREKEITELKQSLAELKELVSKLAGGQKGGAQ